VYTFDPYKTIEKGILKWVKLYTTQTPTTGLMNYGMQITKGGTLVLFGGVTEDNPKCSSSERKLNKFSELWILYLNADTPDFLLVNWIDTEGGMSKILSLGNETVCIINTSFETQMIILDLAEIISYNVHVQGKTDGLFRTSYGIAAFNERDFIIYGGYNEYGGLIKDIGTFDILVQLSFSTRDLSNENNSIVNAAIITSVVLILVVVGILLIFLKKRKSKAPVVHASPKDYLRDASEALENSKKYFENRMLNIANDTEFTATLAIPNYSGLCIPAYKNALFGRDFTKTRYLTKGGFGEIHIGTIVKKQIASDYNSGESSCVIKIATHSLDRNMFLQEMAIHETFRENKYFAKLICYSEDPQTIVLKLYRFGALNNFIWPEKDAKLIGVPYTLGVALDIAKRLAWCINVMHKKGFIHDDIKPGNILLDSDNDEPIFPVISDFGNVKIINSAEVVRGMELVSVAGITLQYAAPEKLKAFQEKSRTFTTFKCDVYSFGMVLYELVTRKHSFDQKMDVDAVIKGKRPLLTERLLNTENALCKERLLMILNSCWDANPSVRPGMNEVYITLAGIWDAAIASDYIERTL
jgi:tRNA A-37 threonylcarbamoyl transferase component Bud32